MRALNSSCLELNTSYLCVANYPAQQNCSKLKQDSSYQGESDDSSNKMKILYVETKKGGKETDNTINEATQEEHEKLCNIRPEDTYRRKIKLGSKTTGQRLSRALHAFHRLYQASTFGGLSNIGSTKTLLLSASVKTLKLTRLHAEIVSSWLGLSMPRPRGHS